MRPAQAAVTLDARPARRHRSRTRRADASRASLLPDAGRRCGCSGSAACRWQWLWRLARRWSLARGRCGTTGHYGRLVLIASEGGITFWTGNHPLSPGEGDMAANPAIKLDNRRLRAAHPGLSRGGARAGLLPRGDCSRSRRTRRGGSAWSSRSSSISGCRSARRTLLHSRLFRIASWVSYGLLVVPRPRRPGGAGSATPDRACARCGCCSRRPSSRAWCSCRRSASVFPSIDPALIVGAAVLVDASRRGAGSHAAILRNPAMVLVVIPTYNERDNLPDLVRAVARARGHARHGGRRQVARRHGRARRRPGRRVPRTRRGRAPHRTARPRPFVRRRAAARARRATPTSSARWTRTGRTIRSTCRR